MRDLSISATALREAKHVRRSIFSGKGLSVSSKKTQLHLFEGTGDFSIFSVVLMKDTAA